jgi:L-ascorbate metabolism protein UlaG (beta-lactamase superfamily)
MLKTRFLVFSAVWLVLSACTSSAPIVPPPPEPPITGDTFQTSQGDLIIHPVNHASFVMAWGETLIYVDPVGGAERFTGLPAPQVVLVTDIHGDHMNADTLTALVQSGTVIVAPQAVRDALPAALQSSTQVLANGGTMTVADVAIEAIPMYNITPERLQYHAKGRGNGYVLSRGGKRVYIAGDTEDIPEMRQLRDIDVAFVPMNLPFTMTVQQAADAVREFKPKAVYPYHSRNSDVEEFSRLVGTDVGVEVRLRTWY